MTRSQGHGAGAVRAAFTRGVSGDYSIFDAGHKAASACISAAAAAPSPPPHYYDEWRRELAMGGARHASFACHDCHAVIYMPLLLIL